MSVTIIGDVFIDIIVPAGALKQGETYHKEVKVFVGGLANVAVEILRLGRKVKFIGKVETTPFWHVF